VTRLGRVEREALTPYARSKQEADRRVLSRSGSHLAIRPSSVFEPGDTHDKLVPRLFAKYRLGKQITVEAGTNLNRGTTWPTIPSKRGPSPLWNSWGNITSKSW
jgi:nucleoside-diphosphate-sugar epimerase